MKRYQFRLETVRRVRRTQEDLAKGALMAANQEVRSAITAVQSRLDGYEQRLSGTTFGTRSGVESFMRERYFSELSGGAVVAAKAQQQAAELHAAQRRDQWSQAARKVKALNRLDERRLEEHRLETARQQDLEVDDIVTGRFGRSSGEQ